ncbi:MAG: hypothetical protein ACREQF_05675, partial [Candidatus Binataceae bacterium]
MSVRRRAALVAAAGFLLVRAVIAYGDAALVPQIRSQPPAEAPNFGIGSQGNENKSLEIAPQPGETVLEPGITELPAGRSFDRSEEAANASPKFVPSLDDRARQPACLGIKMRFATRCFLGAEEHGVEVVEVDPESPAWRAGLKQRSYGGVAGMISMASAFMGPVTLLLLPVHDR